MNNVRQMPEYRPMRGSSKKSARRLEEKPGFMGDVLKEQEGHVAATLMLVLATRGAIFFGMPRTGNALLIRAWIAGEQYEDYCASPTEVQSTLEALRDAAEASLMR